MNLFGWVIKLHVFAEAGFGDYGEANALVGKALAQLGNILLGRSGGNAELDVVLVGR